MPVLGLSFSKCLISLLLGFNAVVTRLPWDNIGVAILTNDYELGSVISEVLKFRLIDEALGLDPIAWDVRFL